MKRFKNILLIHDSSSKGEFALNRALSLAKANQALLTVVDIIDDLPRYKAKLFSEILNYDLIELVFKERQREMHNFITPLLEGKFKVTIKVLQGTPFIEIIRAVIRNKHDLVIKTAQGKGGIKEALFGTTAMHLLRKCPCPVWLIKPSRNQRFNRILLAMDWSQPTDSSQSLNLNMLDIATSLAQEEQSELHIIHVWNLDYETILRGNGSFPTKKINKLVRETKKMHAQWLNKLLGQYPILSSLNHKVHLLKGDARELVPRLAKKKKIKLIIMGTLCRTGIKGFFIGNTAEKMLQKLDCSVLALKPDDFQTPVTLHEE